MDIDRTRARGAMLGLAVGDALGATNEFETERTGPAFPRLASGPQTEMVGRGPFDLAPGQVTDDTEMAACLARSLLACGGLDPADVARRYASWAEHAFDVGNLTRGVLERVRAGEDAFAAARDAWQGGSAGNGSLMRTAPLAVWLAARPIELVGAALQESAITHHDPRCRLACAAFDAAIAAALRGTALPPGMAAAARSAIEAGASLLARERGPGQVRVAQARRDLLGDLDAAATDDPGLYAGAASIVETKGFVRVAFRLAFWHLHHAPSFEAGLVDVVNRQGDSDTNGAITGALLGARFGEGAIPRRWSSRVLRAGQAQPHPSRADCRPATLLELAEAASGTAWQGEP
jgi:ADP-ribosylglycohydrolase